MSIVAYLCIVSTQQDTIRVLQVQLEVFSVAQCAAQLTKFRPAAELTYGSTEAGILFFNKSQEMAQRFSPSCLVTPEISGIWPKVCIHVQAGCSFWSSFRDCAICPCLYSLFRTRLNWLRSHELEQHVRTFLKYSRTRSTPGDRFGRL